MSALGQKRTFVTATCMSASGTSQRGFYPAPPLLSRSCSASVPCPSGNRASGGDGKVPYEAVDANRAGLHTFRTASAKFVDPPQHSHRMAEAVVLADRLFVAAKQFLPDFRRAPVSAHLILRPVPQGV